MSAGWQPWSDTRLRGMCVYCSDPATSRDHVPPRCFLDRPHPEDLPVVPCCDDCNSTASGDEEYVSCLLEVLACGTTDPDHLVREKVAGTLRHSPALRGRIDRALQPMRDGGLALRPEVERLEAVLAKLARGLWGYETAELAVDTRATVWSARLVDLTPEQLEAFGQLTVPEVLPEVGSRLMDRLLVGPGLLGNWWVEVQPGRFDYAIEVLGSDGCVRMVLREVVAAEVHLDWDW